MLPEVFTPSLLRQLEMLKLSSRRAFLGQRQGAHLSLKRGQGVEFYDYRKYELGDNPRHIDWGLYGRSERIYVKRFREEQALSVLILLDSSPSMGVLPVQGISKWEMARDLALALSYVALLKQDAVYVGTTSGGVIPRYLGAAAIHRMSSAFEKMSLSQPADLTREVLRVAARIRFPGVAFMVTDLLMPFSDLERSVNVLLAKNIDLSILRVSSPLEENPLGLAEAALVIDSETGEQQELFLSHAARLEYQRRLSEHVQLVRQFLARRGVRLLELSTEQGLQQIIAENFLRAGVLQ
jgi:uncharacterized protein (DUF58 family)